MAANTTGAQNVAVGGGSMQTNTTGFNNTCLGWESLKVHTTGSLNTAVGQQSMLATTTGTNNVAVGHNSAASNTTGTHNVAIGDNSLATATTVSENTAVGRDALQNTTGAGNTAVGSSAGANVQAGANNTCVGQGSGNNASPSGNIGSGNNIVVLGNNSIATAKIKVDWTVTSDKRDKADVEPLTMGLNFVNKLEPVTYKWDMRSDYSDDLSVTPDGTHKKDKLCGGLLAQDVEILEREYGYKVEDKTSIITEKNESDGGYGLTYSKFIPVLINAVQELSTQVGELKQELKALKGE